MFEGIYYTTWERSRQILWAFASNIITILVGKYVQKLQKLRKVRTNEVREK